VVSEIIGVSAIENPLEAFRLCVVDQSLIDIGLTKIAALGVVTLVARVFSFSALDHLMSDSDLSGEPPGGF